jgi:predicted ester cyclase
LIIIDGHSGLMGMPSTNKQVTITGLHIDRIAGGKIAETWNYSDMMGVMQQLGMKPLG